MIKKLILLSAVAMFFISGCASPSITAKEPQRKFKRFFAWATLNDEATAEKFREIGVTDITARSPGQIALAKKYGMKAYNGSFAPCGKHKQVMNPEEEKHFGYINGLDLPPLRGNVTPEMRAARRTELDKRRIEKNARYGGEPVEFDVLTDVRNNCFMSDPGLEASKKSIDKICSLEGIDGISFDYIGYTNFKGCYCETCMAAYAKFLAENKISDTQENKDRFYLGLLVKYYNDMADYVRGKYPNLVIMAHLYPVFQPDPLYGNRLNIDYCGQTVAWYFPWEPVKIRRYTEVTVKEQGRYFKTARGIPFIGLNKKPGSLAVKDAATVEKELKAMLAGGADALMICSANAILEDTEMFALFKRYCGREK